jgi:hypothetical protein
MWRTRLLATVAVTALLMMILLVVSTEARHAICRVRGLHAVCTTVGISDDPSSAEQAQWDEALAQHTKGGLQAYLSVYPQGSYAEEARSRLAGCRTGRVEALGSPQDIKYPWTVNQRRANPLPSEEEARGDALVRGNEDAKAHCEVQWRTRDLLSTSCVPDKWTCSKLDDGVACGFEGHIICRARDRILVDDDICH